MRRVVVTGLGLLTPLGVGINTNWNRLVSGSVGINKIDNFDVSDLPCKIAGQIPKKSDDPEGGLSIEDFDAFLPNIRLGEIDEHSFKRTNITFSATVKSSNITNSTLSSL